MEMSQGNPLYSYLKQTKMSVFFFFNKTKDRGQKRSCLGVDTDGKGEDIRKGCKRVNIVEILYAHV
jgi:hypothetical protein